MTRTKATRSRFRLTTEKKFDASEILPYSVGHNKVYDYIDRHFEEHVDQIRRWVAQPSISAQNLGLQEMAHLLRDDLLDLGFSEAELVPTQGHPGVWGFYDAAAETTLLLYFMYDVQPIEESDWRVPPFAGEVVDHDLGTVLMGRGAVNQKGPERAFLNAVQSIIAVEGGLPINLMLIGDGEEELGSPHFPEVVNSYEERLRSCTGVLFPSALQDAKGQPQLSLGVKGILYLELEAVGGPQGGPTRSEIHSSYKAVVDSPVWRLVQALATLVTPDGNEIMVPGYYESVRPPSEEEQQLLNCTVDGFNEEVIRKTIGVERWVDAADKEDMVTRLLFETTLNIDGIHSGYTGEGLKTILPHRAIAKVDSRLVPDQRPEEAVGLIRKHLDEQGFADIAIRVLAAYPPAQTSVQTALVNACISVMNKYGRTPSVSPRVGGSAPFYQFTERLGLPLVRGVLGHGSGAHAPNEYLVIVPKEDSQIAGLAEMEKAYVDFIYAVA